MIRYLYAALMALFLMTDPLRGITHQEAQQALLEEFNSLREDDMHNLQLLEDEEVEHAAFYIMRSEGVQTYLEKLNALDAQKGPTRIAILGGSKVFYDEKGFNAEALSKVLTVVKTKDPQAVFFTGNMVYGLEQKVEDRKQMITLAQERALFNKVTERDFGLYNADFYAKQLKSFADAVKTALGDTIPFYPVIGEHEAIGVDSADLVAKTFPRPNAQLSSFDPMTYSVTLGRGFFAVVATDQFQPSGSAVREHSLEEGTLPWLETTLSGAPSADYRFVLGNDLAYSTEGAFGKYFGLDSNTGERDRFWNVLRKNRVLAYFCGNQPLYDRTYRLGVWQIVSGGAGMLYDISALIDETFYHFILLSIPQEGDGAPWIEVFDQFGAKRDQLELTGKKPLITNYRIFQR